MTVRNRLLVLLAAVAALAVVATASVLHASARAERRNETQPGGPRITAGRVTLTTPGTMVFRNMAWGPHRDELTTVPAATPAAPAPPPASSAFVSTPLRAPGSASRLSTARSRTRTAR